MLLRLPKIAKYNPATDQNDNPQFSAIAGDLNNWKQTASDSDDFLSKNSKYCSLC